MRYQPVDTNEKQFHQNTGAGCTVASHSSLLTAKIDTSIDHLSDQYQQRVRNTNSAALPLAAQKDSSLRDASCNTGAANYTGAAGYASRNRATPARSSSSSRGDLNPNFFDDVGVNSIKLLQLGTALDPYSKRKEFANQQIVRATAYLQRCLSDWKIVRFFVSGAYGRKTSMATIDVDLIIFVAADVLSSTESADSSVVGGNGAGNSATATATLNGRLNKLYQLLYAIARCGVEEFPSDSQRLTANTVTGGSSTGGTTGDHSAHRGGLILQDVPSVTSICTDIS
eukprot:Lankesteria_metandrocarpae@DN5132_c0_g1_i1.p1